MFNVGRQESISIPATNPMNLYSNLDLGSQLTLTGGTVCTLFTLKLLVDSLTRLVEELRK